MRLFFLLLVAAQLSGCADLVCSPDAEEPHAVRRLPVRVQDVEDVVSLADDEVIVVSRRVPTATVVTRSGGRGEEPLAVLPELAPTDVARSLTLADGRWWFSRVGFHDAGASVFFVSGGATVQESRRSLAGLGSVIAWLPIRGAEPRGLLVSAGSEQPALRMVEITPSATRSLGAFPWWQTTSHMLVRHESRWSAAALGDGRYVVAAIDGPEGEATLRVRTLGGEAASEAVVPCGMTDQPIDVAAGPAGTVAVVGVSAKQEIVAAMFDVDRAESAQCRVLSAAGEVAATAGHGTPNVVWAGDRFVAAWLRDDGVVRACELREQRTSVAIDVAAEADVRRPLRQLVQSGADRVTFTWRDRNGDVATRELPHELTAYALGMELRRLMCAALGGVRARQSDLRAWWTRRFVG